MPTLQVPGATLSHDVVGTGPLLLLVPGGAMDSAPFAGLAAALADRFTVVRYDARGIGASPFDGEPSTITVAGQAADALALIDHHSPGAPAYVLGSSGGALTGLELVVRHPDRVAALIAHEPPLASDDDAAQDDELLRIHREQGPVAATVAFLQVTGLDGGTPADPEMLPPSLVSNFDVFYRHMITSISAYRADVEALRRLPVRVGIGETSDQQAERAGRALARELGREPVLFAGDHVGFAAEPERFAGQLAAAFA
ncbi:alpha/beta hydrolase [Pseudonocardia spirodelae]|uniref:Alpha/beta hydrolase family protein n=1 Tax=Pseudonocardia spirodelae TaxID=3133431 RepID=A0ABU8T5T3_9PSEU